MVANVSLHWDKILYRKGHDLEYNKTGDCYTEWSNSEREKQILHINVYLWNLEEWYRWTYLQGSNGDTDIQNRLVDTVGEGEGGMNWENNMQTYTLPYVKQIASGNVLCDTGSSASSPSALWQPRGWMGWQGRFKREGTYAYVSLTDLHCCVAEANTTL